MKTQMSFRVSLEWDSRNIHWKCVKKIQTEVVQKNKGHILIGNNISLVIFRSVIPVVYLRTK